jgi:hypothetical protein
VIVVQHKRPWYPLLSLSCRLNGTLYILTRLLPFGWYRYIIGQLVSVIGAPLNLINQLANSWLVPLGLSHSLSQTAQGKEFVTQAQLGVTGNN